ncbi:uncharacterized protein BXZ73DRAFT_99030 [Epithele typhae]|uniref:uncharacterized protein n=1 Tax=Epithele typhae TaxID=378194 RepID=UPI00200727B2|nr:uncharacterized protein BXZ73DRAFT_99030 [Epithele typhae]KAH9940035.1 hypothetical protein BXZ73DRAFT_99030 [Epithele typhae]
MSRNAADPSSSAPTHPPDTHHRTPPQRPPTGSPPPRRTLPSDLPPPSEHTASQRPSSSSIRIDAAAAATASSDPETTRRKRKQSERSSPSVSSSQGDMADTEMEGGEPSKAKASDGGATDGPPPKKKRTRTLTTPHQAAVLHALLAQSRFPTTQMREEVGRAIGLSARKVQNQRQKARRPRGQATTTTAPLTRPPQFGPFTNAPPGTASDHSPTTMFRPGSSYDFFPRSHAGLSDMPYGATSAPSSAGSDRFAYGHRDPYLAEEYARSGLPPTQLAGPGIPGTARRITFDDPAWNSRRSQAYMSRPSTAPTDSPEQRFHPRSGRPVAEQGPELTLTLPPVLTNLPPSRGPGSSPVGPPSAGASGVPRLASISSLEASAAAHASSRPRSFDDGRRTLPRVDFSAPRPVLNIPPPFTLQPPPQWDDPAFSPYTPRRSPPAPAHPPAHMPTPPFEGSGSSPIASRGPFRGGGDALPRLSTVLPVRSAGLSPSRTSPPPSPVFRTRFDPVRSTTGRAPQEHPARPRHYDSDEHSPRFG